VAQLQNMHSCCRRASYILPNLAAQLSDAPEVALIRPLPILATCKICYINGIGELKLPLPGPLFLFAKTVKSAGLILSLLLSRPAPLPSDPWQPAHFDINSIRPFSISCAQTQVFITNMMQANSNCLPRGARTAASFASTEVTSSHIYVIRKCRG